MNFLLLKEIVVQLKRKFRCPKCRRSYANRDINVLTVGQSAFDVALCCRHCDTQVHANVSLLNMDDVDGSSDRLHRGIKVKANSYNIVNQNDVLDTKNFLKNFRGSFKSLFGTDKA